MTFAAGDLLFLSHGYLGAIGPRTRFARWLSVKAAVAGLAQAGLVATV
jgi:hypothetical protein